MPHKLGEGPFLVDATFVVALLTNNQRAVRFTGALGRASIVDVNLGEAFYKIAEIDGATPVEVGSVLLATGLTVVGLGVRAAARFPELKQADLRLREQRRQQGWPEEEIKSLSLADITCLAVGLEHPECIVISGDKYWKTLSLPLHIEDYGDPDLVP